MILRAIYRNGNMAVEVGVKELLSEFVFLSEGGVAVYDIRERLKREGQSLRFDKFRPAKGFWSASIRPDRETETEPSKAVHKKMNGSDRQMKRSRFPELKPRQAVGA